MRKKGGTNDQDWEHLEIGFGIRTTHTRETTLAPSLGGFLNDGFRQTCGSGGFDTARGRAAGGGKMIMGQGRACEAKEHATRDQNHGLGLQGLTDG